MLSLSGYRYIMGGRRFILKASCFLFTVFCIVCISPKYAYCQQIVEDGTANQLAFIYSLIYLPGAQNANAGLGRANAIATNNISGAIQLFTDSLFEDPAIEKVALDKNSDVPVAPLPIVKVDNTLAEMKAALFNDETDLLINKFASMIEVEPQDVENYPLYKFIDKWYGVKYKYGGMDNTGIDCSAFSQKLYGNIFNVNILRTARQQHKSCELIRNYEEASEGDLVFFRVHHIRISHVGVYLANGYFVHASRSRGVMISSLNEKYWQRRYAGCGRVERDDVVGTESDYVQ